MKFSYDPQADALSLRLNDARIDDTDEVQPGIIVDYDENGQVVAVEVLNIRKRTQPLEVNLEVQSSVFGVSPHEDTIVDYTIGTVTTGDFAGKGVSNTKSAAAKVTDILIEA